jgi:hypothetical protein
MKVHDKMAYKYVLYQMIHLIVVANFQFKFIYP